MTTVGQRSAEAERSGSNRNAEMPFCPKPR
jgi:hypothetical protein